VTDDRAGDDDQRVEDVVVERVPQRGPAFYIVAGLEVSGPQARFPEDDVGGLERAGEHPQQRVEHDQPEPDQPGVDQQGASPGAAAGPARPGVGPARPARPGDGGTPGGGLGAGTGVPVGADSGAGPGRGPGGRLAGTHLAWPGRPLAGPGTEPPRLSRHSGPSTWRRGS